MLLTSLWCPSWHQPVFPFQEKDCSEGEKKQCNHEKKNNNGQSLSYPRFYVQIILSHATNMSFSEEILMQLQKPMPLACHQVTFSCNSYNNNIKEGQTSQWIRLMSFKLTVNVFTLSPRPIPPQKIKIKTKLILFRIIWLLILLNCLILKNDLKGTLENLWAQKEYRDFKCNKQSPPKLVSTCTITVILIVNIEMQNAHLKQQMDNGNLPTNHSGSKCGTVNIHVNRRLRWLEQDPVSRTCIYTTLQHEPTLMATT